jgi:hypothetical protein
MNPFSPKSFLRSRRPERFSDSVGSTERTLDRSLLEYHLDTLTNRGQEVDFERFARLLAEREVCPNLLPHTGPTGGGDSKVDCETYPVTDALAMTWFVGVNGGSAGERWAFAFSAKRDWRSKVRSDIAKAAATGRGYVKAFFVTNQFVPDKARATVEDQLRAAHGLDVRVLDRSWILERVFEGHHEALAIEQLQMGTAVRTVTRPGPMDARRADELAAVEARIAASASGGGPNWVTVDDCIRAAVLARALERPRTEVDGRLARAVRMAADHGSEHQRLVAAYQQAYTAYWWDEDYAAFASLYGRVEQLATGTTNPYHLELLGNLWMALHAIAAGRAAVPDDVVQVAARGDRLAVQHDAMAGLEQRPCAALHARTLRLEMRLLTASGDAVDDTLRELEVVVRRSEGLVGYPLEPLVEIVAEWGSQFGDRDAYESLFEAVVEVTTARRGEVDGARMLLRRAAQHMRAGRAYDVIRSAGRALTRLAKDESRDDLVRALYLCASAYERAGLLWAARGSAVYAAAIAAHDLSTYGAVTPLQAACHDRLRWLESQLGRVPQLLAWHESASALKGVLAAGGYGGERLAEGDFEFDASLGILLLGTSLHGLRRLTRLPDALAKLGLGAASMALQYALGHEEQCRAELGPEATADLPAFFARWRDQPARADLPPEPLLYETRVATLESRVLGCHVVVTTENATPALELAEWFTSAFEALMSTAVSEPILPREPTLEVSVRRSDLGEPLFRFEVVDRDASPRIHLRCGSWDAHAVTPETQGRLGRVMSDLLATAISYAFSFADADRSMERLFRDELALDRAVRFTCPLVGLANVLGDRATPRMTAWTEPATRDYP